MKFGFFDDKRKEYVITSALTPLPWINYLGQDSFFSLISNTGGGYSFYKDARLRRITRYRYNNVPRDIGGRMYYIKDGDVIWNPGFLPSKTSLDKYSCRHGLGYSVIESEKNKVSSSLTCFVPINDYCEINKLNIKNNSDETKELNIFSAVEWCLWDAVDDANNFQRNLNLAEVEIDGSVIYHKTEYRERRNHYAFYSVNTELNGFDTDRDSFLGVANGWDNPKAVYEGSSGNSIVCGGYPMASHGMKYLIPPNEEIELIFLIGYVENKPEDKWEAPNVINKSEAKKVIDKYSSPEAIDKALDDLKTYWENLLNQFQIDSPDEKLNRMMNIWNQYQCLTTFNMSRSASYFESGIGRGMGFRDSCQDLLGFVQLSPERARQRILDLASVQFEDGSTYHQYQPLTKKGNAEVGSGFRDDSLWLIACVCAYIKETGDHNILDELAPFNNKAGSEKSLFEHLRRSAQYTLNNLGPHGLPLIGRADWNDCLNLNCFSDKPGESFQTCENKDTGIAESVFIAAMFSLYGRQYTELCKKYGDEKEAEAILKKVEAVEKAVIDFGWDGEWFLRAYDALGNKVGSKECEEGQIYIEPQGFCSMAGIGREEGKTRKALDSVKERLTTKYGTCLLSPAYSRYHLELGEISSYPPGFKENGSIFCHTNPWIIIGEALEGNAEEAFEVYKHICPAYLEDISDIHMTEPYVYCQTIAGKESPKFGQSKNSWLTGTAAWNFVAMSQFILGIRPDFDGLVLDPCLPKSLSGFNATRYYRGAVYHISVKNSGKSTYELVVDGNSVSGKLIPIIPGKKEYNVELTI